MLESVLIVTGQGKWQLCLYRDPLDVDEACWPWKRCGKNLVQFTVCRSSVDASILQVVANLSPAVRVAFAAMTAAFPKVAEVPRVLFVQVVLARWPKHTDVIYQLAWQLGQRLDGISVASMQGKQLQCDSFSVSKADPFVFGNSAAMDNRLLVAYSCVTLRTFKSQQDLSLAYDKGRVFSKGLGDGLIVSPANASAWGPPRDSSLKL